MYLLSILKHSFQCSLFILDIFVHIPTPCPPLPCITVAGVWVRVSQVPRFSDGFVSGRGIRACRKRRVKVFIPLPLRQLSRLLLPVTPASAHPPTAVLVTGRCKHCLLALSLSLGSPYPLPFRYLSNSTPMNSSLC